MSRIGEVYRVKYKDYIRYFQFVAIDQTTLNSDVIAVFNHKSENSEDISLDKIVVSGVEFFTHTTINAGVKQKLWKKVGKTEVVDYSEALFKTAYYKDHLPDIEPFEANSYHSWVIWHVSGEWQHIGADIDKYPQAELGAVYPPEDIVYRIEHGRYDGVPYYGQVH